MSRLKIISHQERKSLVHPVKMVIFGPPGIGKTSLLKTLDEPTLCIDLEAGLLAVQDWEGDSMSIRSWPEARNIACLLGGPNPALGAKNYYSQADYTKVCSEYGDPELLKKYKCIFIDSVTVASRLCFQWAQTQPECMRNGRLDTRAAYGLLGREMTAWITQLQHIGGKDIIMVGLLDQKVDDDNKVTWIMQCEGNKTALELPGIVDEVLSMVPVTNGNDIKRQFVCNALNPFGYPAKDRSGRLDMYEEAHLGNVLKKIKSTNANSNLFVFQSNGVTKQYSGTETLTYLKDIIKKLSTRDKLDKFSGWCAENKVTLDRFYEEFPDSKAEIDHSVGLILECLEVTEQLDNKEDAVSSSLNKLSKSV